MRSVSIGKNLTAGTETIVYTVPTGYIAKWVLLYAHMAQDQLKQYQWIGTTQALQLTSQF